MASIAIASLISTIKLEFLQPFPRVPLLLHDHQPLIQSLFERICSLQAFLKESSGSDSGSGDGGAKVKFLKIKIRDFALEAEDGIEIQLSNVVLLAKDKDDEGEHREKASQELHQTLQKAADNATQLLNIINSTRNEVMEASETQPSIHAGSKQDFESQDVELDGSLRYPPSLEDKMVGRVEDYKIIMHELAISTLFPGHTKFVWIVGMPGIGKTTLAESVVKDQTITKYFDTLAWITMPQKYNQREILCNLLLSVLMEAKPIEVIKRSTLDELAEQVKRCLQGKRFLIVLDNLWSSQAWDDIKPCFPDNKCGSCILLTTTHFDRHSYATSSHYVHYMTLLDSNHSWDIFFNILSGKQQRLAPKFENIRSHEIMGKCDGLPQLIVTVAKRLSKCNDVQ